MNSADLDHHVALARSTMSKKPAEYDIESLHVGGYPYWDEEKKKSVPAVAIVFPLLQRLGTKRHNVILACTSPGEYSIWCGDNFIENKNTKVPAEDRISQAVDAMPAVEPDTASTLMSELHGVVGASAPCHFWTHFNRTGKLCKHCAQVLTEKASDLPNYLSELDERFESDILGISNMVLASSSTLELARDIRKVPLLLAGEKGWGKTHEARELVDLLDAQLIVVQGHENVEAQDLTGYTTRYGNDMVWKDGRLAQAFRSAAKGNKVLLLLDELLRIPGRQLSVLLSALAPSAGHYELATGRIVDVEDGIGNEETLRCSVNNLFVVATTNIGVKYAVDPMDPALQERFLLIIKSLEVEKLRSTVLEFASGKGFVGAETIAENAVKFFHSMTTLKSHSLAADVPNPRTMIRAVHMADTEEEIGACVSKQILTWVSLDVEGQPVPEQLDAVNKAIRKVWP